MTKEANIRTASPFTEEVYECILTMVGNNRTVEDIKEVIHGQLKLFNGTIMDNQHELLAKEVVARVVRGQSLEDILREPHMPPRHMVLGAIENSPAAKSTMAEHFRMLRASHVTKLSAALDKMFNLTEIKNPTADQKREMEIARAYIGSVQALFKSGLFDNDLGAVKPGDKGEAAGTNVADMAVGLELAGRGTAH